MNLKERINSFLEDDNYNVGQKKLTIERMISAIGVLEDFYDYDKSIEWNITFLTDVLSNDSHYDFNYYNHDIAMLAIECILKKRVEL